MTVLVRGSYAKRAEIGGGVFVLRDENAPMRRSACLDAAEFFTHMADRAWPDLMVAGDLGLPEPGAMIAGDIGIDAALSEPRIESAAGSEPK